MTEIEIKLCSDAEIGDLFGWIVCDLPTGHKGPHKATIYWGDEAVGDDE